MANELRFTFVGGADQLGDSKTVDLGATVLVGRTHTAGVRFTRNDADVSGRHVEIQREADGSVSVVALKPFTFNERDKVAAGERRRLKRGDVLTLGPRSRAGIRIDALPAAEPQDDGAEPPTGGTRGTSLTGATAATGLTEATVAAETSATGATVATGLTEATVALDVDGETEAISPEQAGPAGRTRLSGLARWAADSMGDRLSADSASLEGGMCASPEGGMCVSPEGGWNVEDAATGQPFAGDAGQNEGVTADSPTADGPTTGGDPTTHRPTGGDPTTSRSTGDGSGERPTEVVNGETIILPLADDDQGTKPYAFSGYKGAVNPVDVERHFRQRLMVFVLVGFAALLGAVIYSGINHADAYLGHRGKALVTTAFKGPSGEREIQIDYPKTSGSQISETATSLDVWTATGKKFDCPFHLAFSFRTDPAQLNLSLEEAARNECALLEKKGYSFQVESLDDSVASEERAGYFFFEDKYPGSCEILRQEGTRFFRHEYIVSQNGKSWWGVLILFRDGDRIYRLLRDIPEYQKARGRYLLLLDPNIALYAPFLKRQWESLGAVPQMAEEEVKGLQETTRKLLEGGNPGNWAKVARNLNALMVRTYGRNPGEVIRLGNEFRDRQYAFYRACANRRDVAVENKQQNQLDEANACVRAVFGQDPRDWRFWRCNDPKEWPCEIPRR